MGSACRAGGAVLGSLARPVVPATPAPPFSRR